MATKEQKSGATGSGEEEVVNKYRVAKPDPVLDLQTLAAAASQIDDNIADEDEEDEILAAHKTISKSKKRNKSDNSPSSPAAISPDTQGQTQPGNSPDNSQPWITQAPGGTTPANTK